MTKVRYGETIYNTESEISHHKCIVMHTYAHSVPGQPEREWEALREHLHRVGEHAGEAGAAFGWRVAAHVAGQLHDIGKVSQQFQTYIRADPGAAGQSAANGGDHSSAGARVAAETYGPLGRMLAFGIAGHHAGLADASDLDRRLDPRITVLPAYRDWPAHTAPLPPLAGLSPPKPLYQNQHQGFSNAFLTRMLFSCLVDADCLETERFYAAQEGQPVPRGEHRSVEELLTRLRGHQSAMRPAKTEINQLRATILAHVTAKAALPPGLFTLTVPTGGGKTLTSLSFALEHAVRHGLRRVVYVIPYTSIIEQTASVFRHALDTEDDVLEHHASFDWERPGAGETDDGEGRDGLAKLQRASENWDVPVVVTTAVQFFESLFAANTRKCRKLHNLAGAVIVLDEAQTLPLPLLHPCLAAIDELRLNYGASVVLCTATQPALKRRDDFKKGLDIGPERDLAPDPQLLYARLKRVRVERLAGKTDNATLAARFAECPQMLCIVNSRAHAAALFQGIGAMDGAVHLTTLMCPAHRRAVLARTRQRLLDGLPVRLVATSLIEAGVDISFPEVWRAMAGLDSIAQAAGRCNREGELPGLGRVVVFEPAEHQPPRSLALLAQVTAGVLARHDDPLTLDAVTAYFKDLYWTRGEAAFDAARLGGKPFPIMREIADRAPGLRYPFASIAQAFRMITAMDSVVVPWRSDASDHAAADLLTRIARSPRPLGPDLRRLQQYMVPIPSRARADWLAAGALQPVHAALGPALLRFDDLALYDPATGIRLSDPTHRTAEDNIF